MNIHHITSNSNNKIKHIKTLSKRKIRELEGLYIAEGASVVNDSVNHDADITEVYVSKSAFDRYSEIVDKVDRKGIAIYCVSDNIMDTLTPAKNPQGILAIIKQAPLKFNPVDFKNDNFVIALDALGDPGNMGTIIRTADAVGAGALIIGASCVDVYNEKVVRASMGSLSSVRIYMADDLSKTIADMQKFGWKAGCGHLSGTNFFKRNCTSPILLVIGNEAHGVSDEVSTICDYKWKLPMFGRAESLNAAVAAGVMMYELAIKKEDF